MLVHASQAPARAPRTGELKLCDFPRSHHTSVVFERLDVLGPERYLLIACEYDPRRSVGRSRACVPTSTGGRG